MLSESDQSTGRKLLVREAAPAQPCCPVRAPGAGVRPRPDRLAIAKVGARKSVPGRSRRPDGIGPFCLDLLSTQGDAAMRLGVAALLAILLTACSDSDAGGAGQRHRIGGNGRKELCRPAVEGQKSRALVLGLPATDALVSISIQNFLKHSLPVPCSTRQSATTAGLLTFGGICTT